MQICSRAFVLSAALVLLASPTFAQDEFPVMELYGGFIYGRVEEVYDPDTRDTRGFQVGFTRNLNTFIGIATEFSIAWGEMPTVVSPEWERSGDFHMITFLSGPRFTKRWERVAIFAHALSGFAQQSLDLTFQTPSGIIQGSQSFTGYAMAVGGGMDVKVGPAISVRVFQADYLPAQLYRGWQQTGRVSAGIIFTFR